MKIRHITFGVGAILLLGAAVGDGGITVTGTTALLREFGFPVFVSLWFMWRVEKKFDAFTESIQKLLTVVTVMAKTLDGVTDRARRPTGKDVP